MSEGQSLQAGRIQSGDLVYFSCTSDTGEELVWTTSLTEEFRLLPKAAVHDPSMCLFLLDGPNESGNLIKPLELITLKQILINKYVASKGNEVIFKASLDVKTAPLALSVATNRLETSEFIQDNDLISLSIQSGESSFTLSRTFLFKGVCADTFTIRRFDPFTGVNQVKYGQVCKLRSDNDMYLSVRPNLEDSYVPLFLAENLQSADISREEFCLPEYTGHLKADLTSDFEDGNNMWSIEREDWFRGGELKPRDHFYLRHLASRKYLKGDMTLQRKDSAELFQLELVEQTEGTLEYGEFKCLLTGDSNVLQDYTPFLGSIQTQIFENFLTDLNEQTTLRVSLTAKSAFDPTQKLKFCVTRVSPEQSRFARYLSVLACILPKLRLAIQNSSKLENAHELVENTANQVRTDLLLPSSSAEEYKGRFASDVQIVNEVLRLFIVFPEYRKIEPVAIRHSDWFGSLETIGNSLALIEKVARSLHANTKFMLGMTSEVLATFLKLMSITMTSTIPSEVERIYLAETLIDASLPRTLEDYRLIRSCVYELLRGTQARMMWESILKPNGVFFAVFYQSGDGFRVRKLGNDLPLLSDDGDLLNNTAVLVAANFCSSPELTEEITTGMGLSVEQTVALYHAAASNVRLHLAFLYFIAQVHVPAIAKHPSLFSIIEKRKLDNLTDPHIDRLDWFYFCEPNSPIAGLVKDEVYFWLSNDHHLISSREVVDWYLELFIRFQFIKQLIEHQEISDLFVASMVSSAIALTWFVHGTEVPGFSERFPKFPDSGFEASLVQHYIARELLELLKAYQRWKTVSVMVRCSRTQIVERDVDEYLRELDFSEILADFSSKYSINLNSNPGNLLSDDPTGAPVLVKNLNILCQNEDISPKKILTYLFENTSHGNIGSTSQCLQVIYNETNQMRFFGDVTDGTPYKPYVPYVEAIQKLYVSPYQLETSSTVTHLTEYVSALESLADFMRSINQEENLTNFQSFLKRVDFFVEIQRMWSYSAYIGPQFAEEPNSVKLRTLVFELSQLYVQDNSSHRAALLQMMTESDFYPDYPGYLCLLMELQVLKADGKIPANLTQTILRAVNPRTVLAIKVLLEIPAMRSQIIFTVLDYLQEKEAFADTEWEMLTAIIKFVPVNMRVDCSLQMIEKWSTGTSSTWQDGALLLIYADNPDHAVFARSLTAIIKQLEHINSLEVQSIIDHYYQKPNTENPELRYILELLFDIDVGVIYLLRNWIDIVPLTAFINELALFYFKMAEMLDLTDLKSILGEYAKSERVTEEEIKTLERVAAVDVLSPTPDEVSIPPPSFLYSDRDRLPPARPLYDFFLNNLDTVTNETFSKLNMILLSKKSQEECLLMCSKVRSKTDFNFQGKEAAAVLEQIIDIAINNKKRQIKRLALDVMRELVGGIEGMRLFLFKKLQECKLYLRFFGMLEGFIVRYLNLNEKLNEESNPMMEMELETIETLISSYVYALLMMFEFTDFRHYLRSQNEGTDINLISIFALLMGQLLTDFCVPSSSSKSLLNACARLMSEMLVGPCVENQKIVIETPGLLESVQSFLVKVSSNPLDFNNREPFGVLITFLTSLTEGIERNKEAMKPLTDKIQFTKFLEISSTIEQTMTEDDLRRLSLEICKDYIVENNFNLAIRCLILYFSSVESVQVTINSRLLKFISFVEIQHQSEGAEKPQIRSLTFQVPFHAHYLTDRSATQLLFEIDRDSRQEKLDDFTTKVKVCEVEMLHQHSLSRSIYLKAITKHWKLYWYISYCFILAINLMLLFTVKAVNDQRINIPPKEESFVAQCSVVQVIFIILGTASYYIEYWHILRKPLQKRQESTEMEKLISLPNPGSLEQSKVTSNNNFQLPLNANQVIVALARLGYALLACSAIRYPAIYPFLLLQILNFNDEVFTIFKSVTLRGSQLILTLIFSLMIIYMFSFIAYLLFYGYYNPEEGLYCDTLLECFLSTVNLGMRSGGGIGDAFGPTTETDFDYRLIFDLLFFISITTVLMAIVFGIIVDTFSQLRDDRNAIENDMNNVCFICGQKRSVIEVRGEGWVVHTKMVHNPFAYMYFLLHLQTTEDYEFTGIEKEVKQQYQQLDLSFYPVTSKAIGFRDTED